ncbi:MAG: hypothetical protein Q4B68_09590 [Bacteroidales bacterium]|nr:hypothetical protein [Bacteroidales bacterium]
MAWKFVITSDGHLRLGDVRMHRDLLWPGDLCLGGGFYCFDYVAMQVVLDRASYDYGPPQWSKLAAAGCSLKISREYEGFAFVYRHGHHEVEEIDLGEWLGIEWI